MKIRRLDRTGLLVSITLILAMPSFGIAQTGARAWDGWTVQAQDHRWEQQQGESTLWLRNGSAMLEDAELQDGTIEFDLLASSDLGFYGVAFRAADDENFEHFYLRPFVSGNPDASQYTPVFNGVSGWQIYAGERFAQAVDVAHDRWVHVELRIRGNAAVAWVDGERLEFPALQREAQAGMVFLTSSISPARFANVRVTPGRPDLGTLTQAAEPEPVADGVIREWAVSAPFAEARLDSLAPLDRTLTDGLDWTTAGLDVRGIANLARHRTRTSDANTVFAAVTLQTDEARPVRFRFGFSDRAHVYLNGRPLFRGADPWRARDYKFLGTVGLHYELVLPLEAGENRLWIAVSESFGGWGVVGSLVDARYVKVTPRP